MNRFLLTTLAAAALAAHAGAQTIEFRVVERNGQTSIPNPPGATPTTDAVLNFAVQARVVGGAPTDFLGNFSFEVVAAGEPDSNGMLARLLTSNADGTYAPNTANTTNSTVGRGGLAAIYAYLAGINPNFNGLINTSGGTFTNSAGSQQIGLVTGSPTGGPLLLLTDTQGTGNPDTYPGSGTTAPIDPVIATTYLGADGNFVDVYRFRYTVTNVTAPRAITFALNSISVRVGSSLQLDNGVWGPVQVITTGVTTAALPVVVVGLTGACCGLDGNCAVVGVGSCSGATFILGGVCVPNPCPQPGTCCDASGACSFSFQSLCIGSTWTQGGSCSPNPCPQPGACCSPAGTCSITPLSECIGGISWELGGICLPNPCPQPGACCATDGACAFVVQSACPVGSAWTSGGVCFSNPCPQPGACCTPTGSCSFGLQSACADSWNQGGVCNPNPCPQLGSCCTIAGPCITALQSACNGPWAANGSCSPNPCPGACCQGTICTFTDQVTCLTTLNGLFKSPGTTCGPTGNPTSCCPANFNGLNGTDVQDIFDFLDAFFARDPRLDFDRDGNSVVFDIFLFLNDWFEGC